MKNVFLRKENFLLFKSLLYKNGKAQNLPVVAGRLFYLLTGKYKMCSTSPHETYVLKLISFASYSKEWYSFLGFWPSLAN